MLGRKPMEAGSSPFLDQWWHFAALEDKGKGGESQSGKCLQQSV